MDERIEQVLQSMGDPPGASYLRYIYAVQQLDVDGAVEHLHRFFDFGVSGRAVRGEGRDRPVFHWALLNLTSLHFRFGNMAPALQVRADNVKQGVCFVLTVCRRRWRRPCDSRSTQRITSASPPLFSGWSAAHPCALATVVTRALGSVWDRRNG